MPWYHNRSVIVGLCMETCQIMALSHIRHFAFLRCRCARTRTTCRSRSTAATPAETPSFTFALTSLIAPLVVALASLATSLIVRPNSWPRAARSELT